MEITTIWFVFTVTDGDIMNCSIAALDREVARNRLLDVSDNSIDDPRVWYKLVKFHYTGVLVRGRKIYFAVRWSDASEMERLDLEVVVDQVELLPSHVRQNEDDYWIDDIVLT